jgi:hypothetical protein
MATAPVNYQEPEIYHGPPPPKYDEAVGQEQSMPYYPQPAAAPYPPHNGK